MVSNIEIFKEVLTSFEKKSTCIRLQVAAILIKDGRIISTGWNGSPSGIKHCCDHFHNKSYTLQEHRDFSDLYEIHAEQNCIAVAAKNGISTNGAEMYISYSPCLSCAKLIMGAGIKKVYYRIEYDRSPEGLELLKKCNIEIEKI